MMTFQTERAIFGAGTFLASQFLQLAALLTPVDQRWILTTAATSIMTCLSLTLIFQGNIKAIRLIIGRALLSIIGGVLLTKTFVKYFRIDTAHDDVISLALASSVCCIFTFIIGYAMLEYLMRNSEFFAKKLVDAKARVYLPIEPDDPAKTHNTNNPPP